MIVSNALLAFVCGYLIGLKREEVKDKVQVVAGKLRGLKTYFIASKIKIIPKKQVLTNEEATVEQLDKKIEQALKE